MEIAITTVGWLTVDDIVGVDGTTRMGSRGGGALYSAVGARIWSDAVAIHSVAGRPYYEDTRAQIEAWGIDASAITASQGNGLELWLLHETEVFKQQVPKRSSADASSLDRERGPVRGKHAAARAFHIAPQSPQSSVANAEHLASLPQKPLVTMDILADRFIDASAYRDLGFLRHLSAFMPSEAEIAHIWAPASIAGWLRENAVGSGCHMVAKLGERGSLVCEAGTGVLTHVPAYPASVVDTTGAGDSFCGGLVAGLLAGENVVTAAGMGTVSASFVVEAFGALETRMPGRHERDDRLEHVRRGIRADHP